MGLHSRRWQDGQLVETDFALERLDEYLAQDGWRVWLDLCMANERHPAGLEELARELHLDPHVTCVREAAEEAGVEIEVERLVLMAVTGTVTYPNADQTNYLDHTFRARWVSGEAHVADDESASVGWFAAHQLPEPMSDQMRTRIAVALHNPADVVLGDEAAQRLAATRA